MAPRSSIKAPIPDQEPVLLVSCAECRHFVPDPLGDGGGIGACVIEAPAAMRPTISLYPHALRVCKKIEIEKP